MIAHELELRSREKILIDEATMLYEELARERALNLGEEVVEKMITVVRLDTTIPDITRGIELKKNDPIDKISCKPFDVFEGELVVPDFFVPAEVREAGRGDHIFFLKNKQAAPVFDKHNRSRLIANRNGKAKNMANSAWNRQRLGTKTTPALPKDAHPLTEEMVQVILPNM